MSTLAELILEHSTDDLDSTAVAVMKALKLTATQTTILTPTIRDACRLHFRCSARLVEHSSGTASNPTADRAAFLAERFAVGDGRFVTWASATVDDHVARLAMLAAISDGLARTMARHEQAIADIEAAGVKCLGDIKVKTTRVA